METQSRSSTGRCKTTEQHIAFTQAKEGMVPIVIKKASGEVKKSTLASPTSDAASKVELAAVPLTPLEQSLRGAVSA